LQIEKIEEGSETLEDEQQGEHPGESCTCTGPYKEA